MEQRRKASVIIGIDPDVEASGVGILYLSERRIDRSQLPMPALIEFLKGVDDPMVVIEAGWMNHGNYHLRNKGQWHASKIGEQIGRNHEVSKLIGEFCEYHNIPYRFVKPLQKHWKGRDGKITHDELVAIIEGSGLTMQKGRTNQETRDAMWLAMVHSDIPLQTRKHKG